MIQICLCVYIHASFNSLILGYTQTINVHSLMSMVQVYVVALSTCIVHVLLRYKLHYKKIVAESFFCFLVLKVSVLILVTAFCLYV